MEGGREKEKEGGGGRELLSKLVFKFLEEQFLFNQVFSVYEPV